MTQVEAIAHRLESVFQGVRNGTLALQPAAFDVLYAGVDAIGALVPAAAEGRPAPVDADAVIATLERLASHPELPTPDPPAASEPDPPVPGPPVGEASPSADAGSRGCPQPPGARPRPIASPTPSRRRPPPRSGAWRPSGSRVAKLDALMDQVGELTVVQQRVARRSAETSALRRELQAWRRNGASSRPHVSGCGAVRGGAGPRPGTDDGRR